MNIEVTSKTLPAWKHLTFQNLGFSFERMHECLLDVPGYAFLGPTAGLRPRGPASPKGQATLVQVRKQDLGYIDSDTPTYREILASGKVFGLKPARPCIGPQLLFQYEDQPIDEELLIASTPEDLGYNPRLSSFCYMQIGRSSRHRYIESADLNTEPDEMNTWNDTIFVFEQ